MRKLWMHPNGTIRDSDPLPVPLPLGVPSLAGRMTTAGGVAFLSSTLDSYLRAYDAADGWQLWRARLPAGGHGSLGTKMGDSVVAYALPTEAGPDTVPSHRHW